MWQNSHVWFGIQVSQEKNMRYLEQIKKVAVKVIIGNRYEYQKALQILNLPTMKARRKILTGRFAVKCVHNKKHQQCFKHQTKSTK